MIGKSEFVGAPNPNFYHTRVKPFFTGESIASFLTNLLKVFRRSTYFFKLPEGQVSWVVADLNTLAKGGVNLDRAKTFTDAVSIQLILMMEAFYQQNLKANKERFKSFLEALYRIDPDGWQIHQSDSGESLISKLPNQADEKSKKHHELRVRVFMRLIDDFLAFPIKKNPSLADSKPNAVAEVVSPTSDSHEKDTALDSPDEEAAKIGIVEETEEEVDEDLKPIKITKEDRITFIRHGLFSLDSLHDASKEPLLRDEEVAALILDVEKLQYLWMRLIDKPAFKSLYPYEEAFKSRKMGKIPKKIKKYDVTYYLDWKFWEKVVLDEDPTKLKLISKSLKVKPEIIEAIVIKASNARMKMVQSNLRLAAFAVVRNNTYRLPFLELFQVAIEKGLLVAIERMDLKAGNKFSTVAYWPLKAGIQRYAKRQVSDYPDWIIQIREKLSVLRKKYYALEPEDRKVSEKEFIRDEIGMIKHYQKYANFYNKAMEIIETGDFSIITKRISLDGNAYSGHSNTDMQSEISIADTVADEPYWDPQAEMIWKDIVYRALTGAGLDQAEVEIIKYLFGLDEYPLLTEEEVAEIFKMTLLEVRKARLKIINHLQEYMESEGVTSEGL